MHKASSSLSCKISFFPSPDNIDSPRTLATPFRHSSASSNSQQLQLQLNRSKNHRPALSPPLRCTGNFSKSCLIWSLILVWITHFTRFCSYMRDLFLLLLYSLSDFNNKSILIDVKKKKKKKSKRSWNITFYGKENKLITIGHFWLFLNQRVDTLKGQL